ncbi:MAG: transketolase [Gemmatimonadetes bacterium]|nr:transketolase [Gemmatimonadota bacterium]
MTRTGTAPRALALPDARTTRLAIDAVRVLSMDAVQAADCGHPGAPMALAPVGYLLWRHHLRHNPANPAWPDRDRFVLSAGHASMLLYSLLHLSGYDLPLAEIRNFRQWGSRTPGHPELSHTPGVETTTGPLGQGVANSVGMALAERWLAHRFNRPGHDVVDHYTYVICSDGDLMEGLSHEAAELAGHHRLGKLIWVFDDNEITIEGSTALASSTDQLRRFDGYGWHVQAVGDGNDLAAIDLALGAARAETDRPSFIALKTTIAWGSPNKAGTAAAHGSALGKDEVRLTKEALGYPSLEPFWVAEEARQDWAEVLPRGRALAEEWEETVTAYRSEFPELADELDRSIAGKLPDSWESAVPIPSAAISSAEGKAEATRSSSGKIIQALARAIPNLMGGSADLSPSNNTEIKEADSFLPGRPAGRNLHFGVREHAMGGILNGMALHGGVRVYGGTFLIFSDYMRPAIRLAALMGLPVAYVFTHDSIGLGEDGPTHQPIEHLMALRAIPNLLDLRPGDATETAVAWRLALGRTDGPAFLALTRQAVPPLDRGSTPDPSEVARGGYILCEASGGRPEVILIASGSELHLAVEAARELEAAGTPTRVVSLMSWHLFSRQDSTYIERVLPPDVPARVSVEAGASLGWPRWIGPHGEAIGLDRFGASAPGGTLFREFGITAATVVERARRSLARVRGRS